MDAVTDPKPTVPVDPPHPPEVTVATHGGIVVPSLSRRLTLSPLNRRRWENFKSHRRGYWSFWIFLVLFVLSLFAEVIANDKPLIVNYDGHYYFPVVFSYPETTFGGEFETAADYRDPFVQKQIAEKEGRIIWPPIRYSYGTHNIDLPTPAPSPPTWMLSRDRSASLWSSARACRAAATSNTTGSAPTTRAATSSRA